MKAGASSESTKRPQESAILECPSCYSHRTVILNTRPPGARCADCSTVYKIKYESPQPWEDQTEEPEQEPPKKNRKTQTDTRAEITSVPPPKPGFNTAILEDAIAAGPAGIRNAQKIALRHAKRYHEEATDHFRKVTPYLRAWLDHIDSHIRVRARYALAWRPRFLAALSMTHCVALSAQTARVNKQTCYNHRHADPEFAKQWDDAVEHALDLLHARVSQRCLEGDLEPVYWQGVVVGWIRKFSDKLQIEMLRAYRPDRFKTPGTQVNIGAKGDVFVLTEAQRHRLMEVNREFLLSTPVETPALHRRNAQSEGLTTTNEENEANTQDKEQTAIPD